jgi:hypothetical protein
MNKIDGKSPLVFISHISADSEAVRTLQADLDRRFIGSVRFFNSSDGDSLQAGDSWLQRIIASLRESRIVLPILSPAALVSPWVNLETGGAWVNGGTVIPCCVGEVRRDSLPDPYSSLQAINLDDLVGLRSLINRIASEVGLRAPLEGLEELAQQMKSGFPPSAVGLMPGIGMCLGNRLDKLLEVRWRFRKAAHDPARWSGLYYCRNIAKVTDPILRSILVEFTPAIESVPFTVERSPIPRLGEFNRTTPGSVRLAEPHLKTGAAYAFRIYFDPPLRNGEEVGLDFTVEFPEYRLGTREGYILAQLKQGTEISEFQHSSRTVARPTAKLIYRIIIPLDLGAFPAEPQVTRYESEYPDEEAYIRRNQDIYSVRQVEHEGDMCWMMELIRHNPPYNARYTMRWKLPGEREL